MPHIDLALKDLKPGPVESATREYNARTLMGRYALEAEAKFEETARKKLTNIKKVS